MIASKLIESTNTNYKKILTDYQDQSKFYIRKSLPENGVGSKSKKSASIIQITYCSYEKCDYLPVFAYGLLKKLDP